MPTHPLCACLNHVLEQAIKNIQKALEAGCYEQVRIESKHAKYVSNLLNDYLLYQGTERFDDSMLNEYLEKVRPDFSRIIK